MKVTWKKEHGGFVLDTIDGKLPFIKYYYPNPNGIGRIWGRETRFEPFFPAGSVPSEKFLSKYLKARKVVLK